MAPVPEKPTVTVQEAVARKMGKLRAKLGITADDLLPASVALESERNDGDISSCFSKHQAAAKAEAGGNSAARPSAGDSEGPGRCEATSGVVVPDIGRWKQEADDMLSLLGTNADKCTHNYPMTELKRKVISIVAWSLPSPEVASLLGFAVATTQFWDSGASPSNIPNLRQAK